MTVEKYINNVEKERKTGIAREHACRPAFTFKPSCEILEPIKAER